MDEHRQDPAYDVFQPLVSISKSDTKSDVITYNPVYGTVRDGWHPELGFVYRLIPAQQNTPQAEGERDDVRELWRQKYNATHGRSSTLEQIICGLICIVPVLERALSLWESERDAELGKLLVVVNKIITGQDTNVDAFWNAYANVQVFLMPIATLNQGEVQRMNTTKRDIGLPSSPLTDDEIDALIEQATARDATAEFTNIMPCDLLAALRELQYHRARAAAQL